MRVTQQELFRPITEGIQVSTSRLQDLRMAISTGKRVRAPSDDPLAIRRILDFKDQLNDLDQFSSNLIDARAVITQELSILEDLQGNIADVRSFLIQSGQVGFSADERKTLGDKVNKILSGVFQGANSKFLGRYLFAGGSSQTQPFETTLDGNGQITAVSFKGNRRTVNYQISDGIDVAINKSGAEIYSDNKVFEKLIEIRDAFDNNDTATIEKKLGEMDALEDSLFKTIGDFGTRLSQIGIIENRNEDTKVRLEQLRSSDEDADISKMITELQVQETVLQAALATGARVGRISLINFL